MTRDGGDVETGFRVDVGTRVSWAGLAHGISEALDARGLLTCEDSDLAGPVLREPSSTDMGGFRQGVCFLCTGLCQSFSGSGSGPVQCQGVKRCAAQCA